MNPRACVRRAAAGLLALVAAVMATSAPASAQAQKKPNILVIMGDDVGWFNVGAYSRGIM
jgi:ABC-type sugar transport system substrate-binding protein